MIYWKIFMDLIAILPTIIQLIREIKLLPKPEQALYKYRIAKSHHENMKKLLANLKTRRKSK